MTLRKLTDPATGKEYFYAADVRQAKRLVCNQFADDLHAWARGLADRYPLTATAPAVEAQMRAELEVILARFESGLLNIATDATA